MCRAWERGTCQFGDSCKFSHDWKAIWQAREPDLGKLLNMKCPVFEKYGFCHYGLVCRFAECHVRINDDGTYTNEKSLIGNYKPLSNRIESTQDGKQC